MFLNTRAIKNLHFTFVSTLTYNIIPFTSFGKTLNRTKEFVFSFQLKLKDKLIRDLSGLDFF